MKIKLIVSNETLIISKQKTFISVYCLYKTGMFSFKLFFFKHFLLTILSMANIILHYVLYSILYLLVYKGNCK